MKRGNSDVGSKKYAQKKIDQAKIFTKHVELIFGKSKKNCRSVPLMVLALCLKKWRGGVRLTPPPARNRIKKQRKHTKKIPKTFKFLI